MQEESEHHAKNFKQPKEFMQDMSRRNIIHTILIFYTRSRCKQIYRHLLFLFALFGFERFPLVHRQRGLPRFSSPRVFFREPLFLLGGLENRPFIG